MRTQQLSASQISQEQSSFMMKVYGWMSLALTITGIVAYWTASSPAIIELVFGNQVIFYSLLIAEVLCVAYLSSVVSKLSVPQATALFIGYAALNGLTLASIFLLFTSESIAATFFVTAGTFGVMSIYGYFTKRDLTTIGNLAFMALIGLILTTIVNMIYYNDTLYWVIMYAGVLVFIVLTVSDTNKIKQMNIIGNEGTDEDKKEAIIGALTLYLDFINLFTYLVRIFGKEK